MSACASHPRGWPGRTSSMTWSATWRATGQVAQTVMGTYRAHRQRWTQGRVRRAFEVTGLTPDTSRCGAAVAGARPGLLGCPVPAAGAAFASPDRVVDAQREPRPSGVLADGDAPGHPIAGYLGAPIGGDHMPGQHDRSRAIRVDAGFHREAARQARDEEPERGAETAARKERAAS